MKNNFCNKVREYAIINHADVVVAAGWLLPADTPKYKIIDSEKYPAIMGVCEDGSTNAVRILNKENDRVQKIKCGKYIKHICEEVLLDAFDDVEINKICEAFAFDFGVYAGKYAQSYTLFVSDELEDFEKIYNSSNYINGCSFGSCMQNKGYHTFYKFVDASAAWLENAEGKIVARCVIYNKVYNDNGECFRLAERQYASEEINKHKLIDALIEGKYIDGFKRVGAGCGDAWAFVDVNDEDLQGREDLYVEIFDFDPCDDVVSYQDSFKYLNSYEEKIYNDDCVNYDYELDITDGYLESEYCDYTEENCRSTVEAYYHGRWIRVNEEIIEEDFRDIGGEYYHIDDCVVCEWCDECCIPEDAYYSELTGDYYCCESCMEEAEESYKCNNWNECELTGEYIDPDEWQGVEFIEWERKRFDYGVKWVKVRRVAHLPNIEDNDDFIESVNEFGEVCYIPAVTPALAMY